jgi:ABC-type phosphate transport system substrate-binding protein
VALPPPVRLPSFGIAGSNTIGEELMPPLIVAFARKEKLKLNREDCLGRLILTPEGAATHPETAIDCSALGSHFGIPSLKEGLAEIAMLSRPDHRRRAENDAGGGRAGE